MGIATTGVHMRCITWVKWVIMLLALHYWMRDAHHCSGPAVSEMTYTVSSGTLNSTIRVVYLYISMFLYADIHYSLARISFYFQCFGTVVWVKGRDLVCKMPKCWFAGGGDLTGGRCRWFARVSELRHLGRLMRNVSTFWNQLIIWPIKRTECCYSCDGELTGALHCRHYGTMPRVGSGVVRIDTLRFLAGCHTRATKPGSICPVS